MKVQKQGLLFSHLVILLKNLCDELFSNDLDLIEIQEDFSLKQDVIISILGKQDFEDAQSETIELVTKGDLHWNDQGYTLQYEESPVTGLEGTLTTFCKEGDCITLMRQGNVNTQMVFQKGRRHFSLYNTPYGNLSVGVNTSHLSSSITQDGGKIEIEYAIEIDHALQGNNIFSIDVKPATGSTLKQ